ncbi:MAG: ParA family protein [Myxococcales bacterium]
MRKTAILNQKGGVGKTTTAVNLAAALAELGDRVLLLDLDAQCSATNWLGAAGLIGLFEVFTNKGSIFNIVAQTDIPHLDLVPGSPWLAGLERAMAGEVGAEHVFKRAVDRLPADRWEWLLIDCPPSLGLATVSALTAVDDVIVPAEVKPMALAGVAGLMQTIERVREMLNPGLQLAAVVPTRVDSRTNLSGDVVGMLRDRFAGKVTTTTIRESVRLAEAPSFKKPITTYATVSAGAEDYRALAVELRGRSRIKRKK